MDRIIELDHSHGHLVTNMTFTDTAYFADGFWDGPAQQPSDAASTYTRNPSFACDEWVILTDCL